jgi:hypothetical protein
MQELDCEFLAHTQSRFTGTPVRRRYDARDGSDLGSSPAPQFIRNNWLALTRVETYRSTYPPSLNRGTFKQRLGKNPFEYGKETEWRRKPGLVRAPARVWHWFESLRAGEQDTARCK